LTPLWWGRGRIYQGSWGTAPYQRLYQPSATLLADLPLLPEWYLMLAFLATLTVVGVVWEPLLMTIPLLAIALCLSLAQATVSALNASAFSVSKCNREYLKVICISVGLHLMQPLARLIGRFKYGLHPWRQRGTPIQMMPHPRIFSIWSERWRSPEQ